MTAHFHINSIDQEALARAGFRAFSKDGEIEAIFTSFIPTGSGHKRGEPEFERILTACMKHPRAFNAHELSALAEQGMTLTDAEAELVSASRGEV